MAATDDVGEARSLDPAWTVRDDRPGSAALRTPARSALGARDLPAFLSASGSLEPVREIVAEAKVARRDAFTAVRPLRVGVRAAADAPLVAAARHESGAITFHLPEPGPGAAPAATRRGVAGPQDQEVVFSIPVLPGDDLATGLDTDAGRRGIASKIIKTVVFKAANLIGAHALRYLAEKLEQRLWRDRSEGWVRVSRELLTSGRALPRATPNVKADQRALLLIHGTFSHTISAYADLARGDFFDAVAPIYGDRVFGFDHFTISKSPADNVALLLAGLPQGRHQSFDVITHSRGGLVLRTLARAGDDRLRIGRAVLVASPNQGTPLATPQRWEDSLGWFANLLEILPDNPFTTAAEWVSEGLSWLAQNITGVLPGLSSMDVNGEVVAELAKARVPADANWYALASNYSAPPELALRLLDMGVDEFFSGANDLVVPTEGGWQLGASGGNPLSGAKIGCFGPGGNLGVPAGGPINHVAFFRQPETQTFLRKALAGEALGLAPVSTVTALPRRRSSDQIVELTTTVQPSEPAAKLMVEATAPTVTPAAPVAADGWSAEDSLHLIVLPPNDEKSGTRSHEAQLLAIYGSARALAPFRLGGDVEGGGGLWHEVIAFHKEIIKYVEGHSEPPTAARIEAGGAVMFDILFGGEVRRLYDQARFRHQNRRLNVVFTSMIPWVADLPWEFAYDRSCKAFLSTSDVRFVRNVLTPVPADNIPAKSGPLHILLISALPSRAVALSLEEERTLVLRAFQPLIEVGAVKVDLLPQATPAALHAWVRQRRYDVIHFMGHGQFDEETQTGSLIFVDSQRQAEIVPTSCIKDILRGRGIRLVFLNACETGRGARADYNKGVAPGLVADGVPAVVANQYSVLDRFATTFSQQFYWCLAQGLSLGDAARESRIALNYSGGGTIDWAVPVLFARNPDARLCEGTVRLDVPQMLPRTSTAERRATADHRYRINVWDVTDSFAELDDALDRMNRTQNVFGFRHANLTAPYGTWSVDSTLYDGVAYLPAERTVRRLRKILDTLDADFLLCLTDLPLRSEDTLNLYAWWGDRVDRLIIFSTWDLRPPLRGDRFGRALANVAVESLGSLLTDNTVQFGPKGSVFYKNDEIDVEHITGRLMFDRPNESILRDKLKVEEVDALETLLAAFHPPGATGSLAPAPPAVAAGKRAVARARSSRSRKAPSKKRRPSPPRTKKR